jgi:hypothetical protein
MRRLLTPVSLVKFAGADDQAEFRHNAITMAFANVLRSAELGKIGDDAELTAFVRQSLWYGIRQTLAGRMVHRHVNPDKKWGDVFERMERQSIADVFTTDRRPDLEAALRVDFWAWHGTLSPRYQMILGDILEGHDNADLAARYGVSQGRISQMRRRFVELWGEFTSM